jgi:hypothetical protein
MLARLRQIRQPLAVMALLLLSLLSPLSARAGEIFLFFVGNGQWQVNATGLSNVHALDLELRYDPQRLAALTVTAGTGLTGAMSAINDKVPGTIRLGVASTQALAPSGTLLNLQSSAPGAELVVSRFTAKTVDADGKVVATTVRQELPAQSPSPEILAELPTVKTPAPITASSPPLVTSRHLGTAGGTVLPRAEELPTPPSLPAEEVLLPPATTVATAVTNSASATPASAGPEKRFHSQEEIVLGIERLPQPWTVAAIKAIFLKPATASQVRQIPSVAFADGKSRVRLYLPKALSQKIPAVGVQGCTLGSISDAGDLGWEVELVTRPAIWPAKALLLGEGDLIQFPVVIVPTLAITPPAGDKSPIPAVDYDGDGSITALDAYLYVGNLLARQEELPVRK